MIRMVAVLNMLLATVSCIPAKPLSTMPLPSRRDDSNEFCYFGGHRPTENYYRQGVAQYCDNYVHDGTSLRDTEKLVVTITLKDPFNSPIEWFYKMWWADDADNGPVEISHDMCVNNFHSFITDSTCPNGLVKFIKGGKYWIEIGDKKPGDKRSKLWIETGHRA
jgi:hypothetical protein